MFYFTPLSGFFSPFPRGTGSLSVTQEYLALRGGPRRFTRDFTCPELLGIQLVSLNFRLQDFHLLGCSFQLRVRERFPDRESPVRDGVLPDGGVGGALSHLDDGDQPVQP